MVPRPRFLAEVAGLALMIWPPSDSSAECGAGGPPFDKLGLGLHLAAVVAPMADVECPVDDWFDHCPAVPVNVADAGFAPK